MGCGTEDRSPTINDPDPVLDCSADAAFVEYVRDHPQPLSTGTIDDDSANSAGCDWRERRRRVDLAERPSMVPSAECVVPGISYQHWVRPEPLADGG